MAVIRFDPNTVVEIALKYDGGKEVTSRIPDAPNQMMYTLCGDDTIYVPLHVADQITKLGIKRAELFSVCKRVKGNATRSEVKRMGDTITDPIPPHSFDSFPTAIEQGQQQKVNSSKATPSTAVATVPVNLQKTSTTDQFYSPIHHTSYSRMMAAANIAAIDAAREAERYAIAVGFEVEFVTEDIRMMAATLFIAASKDPAFLTQPTQKVNGGTTWPQQ